MLKTFPLSDLYVMYTPFWDLTVLAFKFLRSIIADRIADVSGYCGAKFLGRFD